VAKKPTARRTAMHVLFVCTGNTCRSALAAAIAQQVASRKGLTDIEASSAGTSAWDEQPASDGALLVGMGRQLDLSAHRARQLTKEIVDESDLILTMGPHHLERVEALGGASKSFLLTEYASRGARANSVEDPFGGDLDAYRTTADELDTEIRQAIERLMSERAPSR
jgi:protein-tyrosine-phosphatase